MGVLDFDNNRNGNAGNSGITTSGGNSRRGNQDRPAAKLWLNIGYDKGERFVNLPIGIPLDTMEALPIRGQNEEWAMFQAARNHLLKQLQEAGDNLEPGAEVTVNLTVKLRKVNEALDVSTSEAGNEFIADLSNLIVA